MSASTNLALRPFTNERLPWLLAGGLLSLALFISFLHGRFVSRLLSGEEANTVLAVRQDEARIAELEEGIAKEPPLKIETSELARLRTLKDLVDRRVFPWRRLLAELEERLAPDVRLTRIAPTATRGVQGMLIGLSGEARHKNAAFSLAEALDDSPAFANAVLTSWAESEGETKFELEVVFDPGPQALTGSSSLLSPGSASKNTKPPAPDSGDTR